MYTFTFPMRVYVEDTDMGGIVYHANYLKYMERARTEWAFTSGIDFVDLAKQGTTFVVRSAKLEYLRPARLHDELRVVTRIAKLGRASIIYHQEIHSAEKPDHIYCTGEILVVCINQQMKPQSLPEKLRKVLEHE